MRPIHMHSDFTSICIHISKPTFKPHTISNIYSFISHLTFACQFTYAFLTHYSILDKSQSTSNPFLVHAKQTTIGTKPYSSTHVSFSICQVCLLFTWCHDMHNIEVIPSTPFQLLSSAWTILISWSSITTIYNLACHFDTMPNTFWCTTCH